MNAEKTGALIRRAREEKNLTQAALAEQMHVSDKTVSKWETGRGYPDLSLVDAFAQVLGLSATELFAGEQTKNGNRSFAMHRTKLYVCPLCGNLIFASGDTTVSCCGLLLPPQEAEIPDPDHALTVEQVEDEYFVSLSHSMSKAHFISFLAAVTDNGVQVIKLYPEGNAEARFPKGRLKKIYWYCNRHGLFVWDKRQQNLT